MSFAVLVSFWMKVSLEPSTNSKRISSAGRPLRISGEPMLVSTAIIYLVNCNDRANFIATRVSPSKTTEAQQRRHKARVDTWLDSSGNRDEWRRAFDGTSTLRHIRADEDLPCQSYWQGRQGMMTVDP